MPQNINSYASADTNISPILKHHISLSSKTYPPLKRALSVDSKDPVLWQTIDSQQQNTFEDKALSDVIDDEAACESKSENSSANDFVVLGVGLKLGTITEGNVQRRKIRLITCSLQQLNNSNGKTNLTLSEQGASEYRGNDVFKTFPNKIQTSAQDLAIVCSNNSVLCGDRSRNITLHTRNSILTTFNEIVCDSKTKDISSPASDVKVFNCVNMTQVKRSNEVPSGGGSEMVLLKTEEAIEGTSADIIISDNTAATSSQRVPSPLDLSGFVPRRKKTGSKEKTHACSFPNCDRAYSKSSHLKAHYRRHTGEKPYVCTWAQCDWSFSRSDELARHVRSHNGDKPYACSMCEKKFARSDHVTKHLKVHFKSSEQSRNLDKSKSDEESKCYRQDEHR